MLDTWIAAALVPSTTHNPTITTTTTITRSPLPLLSLSPLTAQISARQQAVSTLKAESEKERLSVTLQPLLREPPALPEPKVLVTPGAPFVPALPVVAV